MQIIHYFFGWYNGQVWPNLLADVVTTGLVGVWGFRKLIRLHNQHHIDTQVHITNEIAKLTEKTNA